MMDGIFVNLSFLDHINDWVADFIVNHGDSYREFSAFVLQHFLVPLEQFLIWLNPLVILAFVAIITWFAYHRIGMVLLFIGLLYLVGSLGLWEKTMQTLSIMIVAIFIVIVLGIPCGILIASSRAISKSVLPILDMMQTFPMFVYMLPAVMLFSIGKVPAIIATVVYAFPPLVRLTELGIIQVDTAVNETATSFGASPKQKLFWVFLPLARQSIMTGLNQTTMMALAMVVVASMIGARGLGEDILFSITNLDFTKGVKAGIAIVIIAMVIDRVTQKFGISKRMRMNLGKPRIVEEQID